jgi:hypothetical protein
VRATRDDEIYRDRDAVLLFEELGKGDLQQTVEVREQRVAEGAVFLVLERGRRDDRNEEPVVAERPRRDLERRPLGFDLPARRLARPELPGVRWRPPETVGRIRDDERKALSRWR